MIGLSEKEEKFVLDIVKKYPEYEFFAYGSRVKGNFVKSSDLDILIKGKTSAPLEFIAQLKEEFYQSLLPFIVNISDYHEIDRDFYEHIKSDLVNLMTLG
jgi:uncharacterized protein